MKGTETELIALLAALKDRDWMRRDGAARALGRLGDPRAATSLAVALEDASSEVQWSAAGALARMGDSRARDFYMAALRSERPSDRWAAVAALGRAVSRGDRQALGPLREALAHPDGEVREAARTLLGAEPF